MPVYNKLKNIALPFEVVEAKSFLTRLVGLLGTKKIDTKMVLYIKHCSGIHTIGMKYPIDVVFLDKNSMVSRLYESLKPNRMTSIKIKDHGVLEFPPGTINNLKIEKGEMLQILTDKYKLFGD
jgi:uncharacterized membrane protein (UPF0127 family)